MRNSDTTARDLVLEHPAGEGWNLAQDLKPQESSVSFHRFRVKVEPGQTAEFKVQEYHPEKAQYALTSLTPDQVSLFFSQKAISPQTLEILQRVLAKKNDITALETQLGQLQQEIESITRDQGRVRENMKALKGSTEEKALLQRYTRELNSQEDRLAALRKQAEQVQQKRDASDAELDRMVQDVSIDAGS